MRSSKKIFLYGLFFLNLLVLCGFWYRSSGSLLPLGKSSALLAIGRLCGLLAVYAVLMQFLMMGRTWWIESVFGLDKITRIHRLNGYAVLFLILFHPILITTSYALDANTSFVSQFIKFITSGDDLLKAFFAVTLFVVVVGTSIYLVRKKLRYEWWYAIHLLTYLAVLLAWGHQLSDGGDFGTNTPFVLYWYALYIFVFGNVLVFRFLRPLFLLWRHRFYVADVVDENGGATSIYLSGNRMESFNIIPGQFMILRFLSPGYWYEAHPFSLSLVPHKGLLRITAKKSGDFTRHKIMNLKKKTPVLIDGPYGVFTGRNSRRDKFLFIAGGIGITPVRSIMEELAAKHKDIRLIYSNKNSGDIVFKKELEQLSEKYGFPIHYILTQQKNHKHSNERLNAEMIGKWVADVKDREIYICGPVRMIESVRRALRRLGVPESQVHFEKFSMP